VVISRTRDSARCLGSSTLSVYAPSAGRL
jgi:hypothetical protein